MDQTIDTTVQKVLEKRPVLEALMKSFAAFYVEKNRVAGFLKQQTDVNCLNISVERLASGIPVLTETSFEALEPFFKYAFTSLLPTLKKAFPALSREADRIEKALSKKPLRLNLLAKNHLEGSLKANGENDGSDNDIEFKTLEFLTSFILPAVLEALEPAVMEKIREISWHEGYCPICGFLPTVSYLDKAPDLSSEFLKGGGGQKVLHCSMCGHEWRILRNLCPACGNDQRDMLLYFQVEHDREERVDVCRKCGLYLPCIDLREKDFKPHMDMAAVGMVYLDVFAQQNGFSPMVWTPWNRLN